MAKLNKNTVATAEKQVKNKTNVGEKKKSTKRLAPVASVSVPAKLNKAKKQPAAKSEIPAKTVSAPKSNKKNKPKPEPVNTSVSEAESHQSESESENETEKELQDAPEVKHQGVSVFVGNLPLNIKRKKLLKLFEPFGKVLGIRFRKSNGGRFYKKSQITGQSLIAFVDFPSLAEATASVAVNGANIGDNVIRVNLQATAKKTGTEPTAFDGKRTVFVGNLAYTVTDKILHEVFSCCGKIEYVRTMNCDKGCSGTAYVCFKDNASITMALELNSSTVEGRAVRVERYAAKKQGAGVNLKKKGKKETVGVERRMSEKNKKEAASPKAAKGEFTGVKIADKKKKNHNKSAKGGLSGPKLLAKKIAPRVNKITA